MSTLKLMEQKEHRVRQQTIVGVPAEVLSKIFIQCLRVGREFGDDLYWSANPTEFNSSEAPLLLTKVCRFWRAVSLSTQRLWTVLPSLGVDEILPGSGRDILFRMYLAHSGSAPLSFHITVTSRPGDYLGVALLSPHLHRAGELQIELVNALDESSREPLSRLFFEHRGRFKLLTHLQLVGSRVSTHSSYFNTFNDAPLLTHVYLNPQRLNLPWSQLRYFRGCTHDALRLCTQLETLDLSVGHESEWSDMQASICLPQLRKLCLGGEGEAINKLLNSLHAPLVEVIQIHDFRYASPSPVGALIAYIIRLRTELTSLGLQCFCASADELLQLSRLAPGLRELEAYLAPDALRSLMGSPTRNNIFVRLARLTIRDVDMPDQELIDICQSRFSDSSSGEGGEFRVEPLQYCKVYPIDSPLDAEYGTQKATWRLQDVAESFQDDRSFQDILDKLQGVPSLSANRMSRMSSEDLEECFRFLETYEISHPLLLERHHFIDIMNHLGNTVAPSHIKMRASALLAKWGPLVREYNISGARWFFQGKGYERSALVYEPDIGGRFVSKLKTW